MITALVLAGGQGLRMGGRDKGLQPFAGQPLAQHALGRLRPQVGALAISANRHLASYRAFAAPMGAAVWPDLPASGLPASGPDAYCGPLAGMAAGLQHCATPWLLTVACDTPYFPLDLAPRLAQAAAQQGRPLALAATPGADGRPELQPVFCLLHRSCLPSLQQFLASGERKVRVWQEQQAPAVALFSDPTAFANANTLEQLQVLEQAPD